MSDAPNASPIDPEQIAAFLDGTATPDEREAVLRQMASSPEYRDAVLEAAAIHRELDDAATPAEPDTPVIPLTSPRGTPPARRLLLVGALAAAAVAAVVLSRANQGPPTVADVMEIAAAVEMKGTSGSGALERTLGPGWDEPGWSVTRGAESTQVPQSRAFRTGVRMAQFEQAARIADSTAFVRSASRLRELLTGIDGTGPLSTRLETIVRTGTFGDARERTSLAEQLGTVHGQTTWFELGLWVETARIASSAGNAELMSVDGEAHDALTRLLAANASDTTLVRVTAPLAEVLSAQGGRAAAGPTARALDQIVRAAGA